MSFNNDHSETVPTAQLDALSLHSKLADMSQPDLSLGTTPMDAPIAPKEASWEIQADKKTDYQGEMVAGTMKALQDESSGDKETNELAEGESKQGFIASARDKISTVASDAYQRVAETAQAARSMLPGQSKDEASTSATETQVDLETTTTESKDEAPVQTGPGVVARTKQAIAQASSSAYETVATSTPAKVISEQAQAAKNTVVETAGAVAHKAEEVTHNVAQKITQTAESAKQTVIETAVAAKNKATEIWTGEAPHVEQAKQDVKDAAADIKFQAKQAVDNVESDIAAQTTTPELEAEKAQAKAEVRGLKNQLPAVMSAIASISTTVVAETARSALQMGINAAADAFQETKEDKQVRKEVQHGVTYDESKHKTTAEQDRVNENIDTAKDKFEQKLTGAEESAKAKAQDVALDAQFEFEAAKDKVEETASDLNARAQATTNEVAENVKSKAQDVQEAAGAKKEHLKQSATEAKENIKDKTQELGAKARNLTADASEVVKDKTEDVKQAAQDTKQNMKAQAPTTTTSGNTESVWVPAEAVTQVTTTSTTQTVGPSQQENLELLHALPFDESRAKAL